MSQQTPVVNAEVTTAASEGVITQVQESVVVKDDTTAKPVTQPGDRTDPNLLLKSLQEEREKRRLLEQEIETLKSSTLPELEEAFSDEGKLLASQIKGLETKIEDLKFESSKKDLQISNPVFKEKWDDFESFRNNPENKGMNLRTAAKAFLIDQDLLEPPARKGLEKTTGGPRVPISTGMTADDVENLRKNNFKKYQELLKKGQIKIA